MTPNLLHTAITQLATTGRVDPNTYSDLHTSARRTLAQQFGVRPDGTTAWPADARRDATVELYLVLTDEQPNNTSSTCADCPFRNGSPLGYDADALAALDLGVAEPSCHALVGKQNIFTGDDSTRCRGYDAWCADRRGFRRPRLAKD